MYVSEYIFRRQSCCDGESVFHDKSRERSESSPASEIEAFTCTCESAVALIQILTK